MPVPLSQPDLDRRFDLIGRLIQSSGRPDAGGLMDELVGEMGFDFWGYAGFDWPDGVPVMRDLHGSDEMREAAEEYAARGLAESDPILAEVAGGAAWVSATALFRDPRPLGPRDRRDETARLLLSRGVRNIGCFMVPDRRGGFAHFSVGVSSDEKAEGFDAAMAATHRALRLAGTALLKVPDPEGATGAVLTQAEAAALRGLARGQSPQEIAAETGRSVRTVRHQIDSGRKRLNAPTTVAAVVVALELGEITAGPR